MRKITAVFGAGLFVLAGSALAQQGKGAIVTVENAEMIEAQRAKAWKELFENKPQGFEETLDERPGTGAPAVTPSVVVEEKEKEEEMPPMVDPSRMRRQLRLDRAAQKQQQEDEAAQGLDPTPDNTRMNFKGDGRMRREARRERAEILKKQEEAQNQVK